MQAVTVSAQNPEEGDLAGLAAVAAEERLGLTPDWWVIILVQITLKCVVCQT